MLLDNAVFPSFLSGVAESWLDATADFGILLILLLDNTVAVEWKISGCVPGTSEFSLLLFGSTTLSVGIELSESFFATEVPKELSVTGRVGNALVGRGLSLFLERLLACFPLSDVGLMQAGGGGGGGGGGACDTGGTCGGLSETHECSFLTLELNILYNSYLKVPQYLVLPRDNTEPIFTNEYCDSVQSFNALLLHDLKTRFSPEGCPAVLWTPIFGRNKRKFLKKFIRLVKLNSRFKRS